jgi:hypothetical protein
VARNDPAEQDKVQPYAPGTTTARGPGPR